MIEMKNAGFTYGDETAESESSRDTGIVDIHLQIRRGECVLLCGESGCGKTTVTKLINGLIPHFEIGNFSGEVTVNELDTKNVPMYQLAECVSSVFQNPKTQFFNTDAESEMTFGLENQAASVEYIDKRLAQTIEELDLTPLMNKSLFQMSGGEKQIIAFAGAYLSDTDIVVLDEPSANLDLWAIEKIRGVMEKMKAAGKTIVIAEHRLYYLRGLVDTVYYMKNGRILESHDVKDFFALDDQRRIGMGLRKLNMSDLFQITRTAIQAAEQNRLRVENLTLTYQKKPVFSGLSFEIFLGEIVGIIGANGMGKTSLLRCLCGIQKPDKGIVRFNGRRCRTKDKRRLCGVVMQDVNYQLFSDSVESECFLGNAGTTAEQVNAILNEMGLSACKDAHPQGLSGGQKQRLAIAVTVLSGKKILLLDEPTSGLDYQNMLTVSSLLRRLSENGMIIVVVTHDIEFLETTCNRCLELTANEMKAIDSAKIADVFYQNSIASM